MLPVAILAGGLANRLRPLTENVPKALLPVNGEPFLAHQLRLLRTAGIERVVLCVGYLGERIQEFVGNGERFGLTVEYCFDGPTLLGTAGAVKMALPRLGRQFFVLYGDSYLPCDYRAVMAAFESSGKEALMTLFRNEGQWDASNTHFADGRILAYDKRNPTSQMRHIDYGLGVFRDPAFAAVSGKDPYDLALLYGKLLRDGELAGLEVRERFYEIGSSAGLRELSEFLAGRVNSRTD
ncbi:MAG: nucleotidyltransferase family protein [Bryobacteraceae bacterium]